MKVLVWGLILAISAGLTSCFWRTEKGPAPTNQPSPSLPSTPTSVTVPKKDRSLEIFAKYFEQADAIHREAWWVLTAERRPTGKSPFGKVQRAILSSEGAKLPNKSAFRCDRYIFKRDILGASGYPQKGEVFEKCLEKEAAKKIAEFFSSSPTNIEATFLPENLEEILGLGATVLNRPIKCSLKGNESEQLEQLKCIDWAQDRTNSQMIRLDEYDYTRSGKNLIKLRGKVYENLTDTRKIEADVPMDGKIIVKETELYPPEPIPSVAPTGKPTGPKSPSPPERAANAPPLELRPEEIRPPEAADISTIPIPPPRKESTSPENALEVDPDVLMQQQQQQSPPHLEGSPPETPGEGEEGALEYEQQLQQQPPSQSEGEIHGR